MCIIIRRLTRFEKFQRELAEKLEGHWAQVVIVFLLILDMMLSTIELLIDVYYGGCVSNTGGNNSNKAIAVSASTSPGNFLERVHLVLYILSLSILSIFFIEIVLKVVAYGWQFFTKWMFVFDAIVIISSLALESFYGLRHGQIVSLLVMLRLWRVIRIVYAVAYTEKMRHEQEMNHLKKELQLKYNTPI